MYIHHVYFHDTSAIPQSIKHVANLHCVYTFPVLLNMKAVLGYYNIPQIQYYRYQSFDTVTS